MKHLMGAQTGDILEREFFFFESGVYLELRQTSMIEPFLRKC